MIEDRAQSHDQGPSPAAGRGADPALQRLMVARSSWRRTGQRLVWTNGCFDVLHPGHVRFLAQARTLGDVLVVGINDDDSVRLLKGPARPFVALAGRIAMLSALRVVDHVIVLSGVTPIPEIQALLPDIACKDSEYAQLPLPEREVVESYGGSMLLLPRDTAWSTTSLTTQIARASTGHATAGAGRGQR